MGSVSITKHAFTILCRTNKSCKLTMSIRSISSIQPEITAGVIIIGDEILNGQTEDINTPYMIKHLNLSNIHVNKVSIVPDDIDAIVNEVTLQSSQCTVVLTSGGIGPTHDDITYEAVAKAFSEEIVLSKELYGLYETYFLSRSHSNSAVLKFASIPKSAVLNFGINREKYKFPIVSVRNVYMLPGVPVLLKRGFKVFMSNFKFYNITKYSKEIFLTLDEFSITSVLNDAVEAFKTKVTFGSYPAFQHNYYKVKLVLHSSDINFINEAVNFLTKRLPSDSIITLNSNILLMAKENVYNFSQTKDHFSSVISATEKALTTYKLSEICLCFNGGKDCTALLHILYACAQKLQPYEWKQLKTLYIKTGDSFEEVDNFIQETVERYDLSLITASGSLKEATSQVLSMHPEIKAVLLGTRRADPGAKHLSHFRQSDEGWPSMIRIQPLLNCSYADLWTFIRTLQIPYCVLYDRGYTSLGTKSSTKPNPSLCMSSGEFPLYKPAYMLEDENDERGSRT